MRTAIAVGLLLMALTGCGGSGAPNPVAANSAATEPPQSQSILLPEFPALPDRLRDTIQVRRQRADGIEVDPASGSTATADEIRKLLREQQELVRKVIAASVVLAGSLPADPQFSDSDIQANQHLFTPSGRLVVIGRDLLLADAARCWESHDANGCAERIAASMRIAHFMLRQADQTIRLRGKMILVDAVFELAGRVDDGIVTRIDPTRRAELGRLLTAIDPIQLPYPSKGTPFDKALERTNAAIVVP